MLVSAIIRNLTGTIGHRVGACCWSRSSFCQFGFNVCTQRQCSDASLSSSGKGGGGEEGMQAKSLSWRIEKLSRGDSVASAFQSWMGDGFPIGRGDIFHAINRLRKLKANKRALEVCEFIVNFSPTSELMECSTCVC